MEKNKEKNKKVKIKINKKKLIKFLAMFCIVMGILKFILDKNVFDDIKIQNRVNSSLPLSITIQDSLYIKQYAIDKYVAFIMNDDTEKAYAMLTDEYKSYKTYDEYLEDIEGIDFSTFKLQEVKQISEKTYLAFVEYERNSVLEEEQYIILVTKLNEKNMKISLDKFLYSFEEKVEFSEDGIKYVIEKCIVNSDIINMTITVKNNNIFEEVIIEEIGIAFNEIESKMKTIDDGILKPGQKKTYNIEIDSNYYIPKYLKVNRNIDNEIIRTYLFDL